MPRAITKIASSVKPGFLRSDRRANRRSITMGRQLRCQRHLMEFEGTWLCAVFDSGKGSSKSEKGNVSVPLRRVVQIQIWDRDFLVPFSSGNFRVTRVASKLLVFTQRRNRDGRSGYLGKNRRIFAVGGDGQVRIRRPYSRGRKNGGSGSESRVRFRRRSRDQSGKTRRGSGSRRRRRWRRWGRTRVPSRGARNHRGSDAVYRFHGFAFARDCLRGGRFIRGPFLRAAIAMISGPAIPRQSSLRLER